MQSTIARKDDMFKRVRDFGESRHEDFPPAGLAGKMFLEVIAAIVEVARHAMLQAASAGSITVGSAAKARLRASLMSALQVISRAARAIADDHPDLKKKFRLKAQSDEQLLAVARAFAEEAEPLMAEFIKHEMPADFLVKLKADIDAFDAAVTARNQSKEAQVKATASMNAAVARAMKAVRHLDVAMRNKYADDPVSLAAWESARRIERHHGRSREGATTDKGSVDTVKPKSSKTSAAG